MPEKIRIETSGKISELIQKEKNFAMILEGRDTKFYIFGKIPENMNVGNEIKFNYIENVVGQFTYKNVQEIHPEGYEPEEPQVEPPQIDFEKVMSGAHLEKPKVPVDTGLKIIRQNTLRTSVMALDLLNKIDPSIANKFIGESGGFQDAIRKISRNLEKEILRDGEDEEVKDIKY